MANENLGPAERIIQALLTYNDHLYHGRPGMIVPAQTPVGVQWSPVTHKEEDGKKVVYRMDKVGNKTVRVKVGALWADNTIRNDDRTKAAEYRPAGLFPEVCAWMYRQVAEVWKLDNEFAAKWASYAFGQEHLDLKMVLAAFMLCQSRKGDPVRDGDKVAFYDEDYRDVGEAMMLLHDKKLKGLDPKRLLRMREFLKLPQIADINRELGFGRSARNPFYGRWEGAVEKWLRYREQNAYLLDGLIKAGYKSTVRELASRVGYKPDSPKFFKVLGWKQEQHAQGHRTLAIGEAVVTESWQGLTEEQICQKVVTEKPNFKRVVGLLPVEVGVTRAIMAACIEAGSLSDKDLIIASPTLEELGLLKVQEIRERWEKALKSAEDMRAGNIAKRVKNKDTQDALKEADDSALQKAVEEVSKNIRVYFFVDISGSMTASIGEAKGHIARFLQAFPPERLHVAVFNTTGREVEIKHASTPGVENAFRGIAAGGGTDHASGIRCLQHHKPTADEDSLFIFVGDEGQAHTFETTVEASGLRPMAFGFVKLPGDPGRAVTETARKLGVPCFSIDKNVFLDSYAIPRTIRNIVAATPVGPPVPGRVAPPRVTLVDQISKTDLLVKPTWAA